MNIYDVAKRAGVSTATVSRVINGKGGVSQKTSASVNKVMREMNYMPNQVAAGLARNPTKAIGIMIPDVRDSFHAMAAYLIEEKMSLKGYTCILCNTDVKNSQEGDYLNVLHSKKVDGIVLVGSSYQSEIITRTYSQWVKKIPIVLINAVSTGDTASVICDEKAGFMEALIYLRKQGKRKSVFIKDGTDYQKYSSNTKAMCFWEAYKEVYMGDCKPAVYTCIPDEREYLNLIPELKSQGIDSILFTNDMSCAIFLKSIQKKGLRSPEDYSLIGFNNDNITNITTPTITTIDYNAEAHCHAAAEKLENLMSGGTVEKITYIKPSLVIKET